MELVAYPDLHHTTSLSVTSRIIVDYICTSKEYDQVKWRNVDETLLEDSTNASIECIVQIQPMSTFVQTYILIG